MNGHKNGMTVPDASALLESGPGSVALLDATSEKLLYVNKQFELSLGYSKDEIQSPEFHFGRLLAGEQMERFMLQLDLLKESPSAYNKYYVYNLISKDGSERSYYLYAAPLEHFRDLYHLLIIPDISTFSFPFSSFDARDLFIRQLETERYGSFEWILDSGRLYWTDSLYNIYEIEKGEPMTRELVAQYTHPDDARKTGASMQRLMENGGEIDMEMKIVTGKKNVKAVKVLAKLVNNDEGRPVKLVGSVKDITAQRKIEQDLKRKVEELNRSNKELEEFAYVASHDLQEPLRKISTFSERLSDKYKELLTGEGAMYLERMMVSAENMRILINNLLEYSRVTRHNEPFTRVNLGFVLRQVKTDLELIIEETGAQLVSGELPEVDGSLSQLSQLFTNIVGNAIKFRKPDVAPEIKIESVPVTEEDKARYHLADNIAYCKIQITDNGIGFEPEYANKIFQIFQRLHGKSEYPGSGIGLAICKRIVENHQGAIYAEGTEGQGASFSIILAEASK
jgi:PAS domain S-box-containing protein